MPLDTFLPLAIPAAVVLATLFWFLRKRKAFKKAVALSDAPASERRESAGGASDAARPTSIWPVRDSVAESPIAQPAPGEPGSFPTRAEAEGTPQALSELVPPREPYSTDHDLYVDDSAFDEQDDQESDGPLESLTEPLDERDPIASANDDRQPQALLADKTPIPGETTPIPGEATPVPHDEVPSASTPVVNTAAKPADIQDSRPAPTPAGAAKPLEPASVASAVADDASDLTPIPGELPTQAVPKAPRVAAPAPIAHTKTADFLAPPRVAAAPTPPPAAAPARLAPAPTPPPMPSRVVSAPTPAPAAARVAPTPVPRAPTPAPAPAIAAARPALASTPALGETAPARLGSSARISPTTELEKSDPRHLAARRFARLAVSEIVLYHEADVQAGRQAKDLWTRFKADIDLCVSTYDRRFPQEVRDRFDYLYDELVHQLAQGDAEKLGPHAPRPASARTS